MCPGGFEKRDVNVVSRVAVIGMGNIGARHLHVLRQMRDVYPVAISRRPERAKELATLGYMTAGDLRVAADMGATFCIIATETGRHVQDGLLALENGLDVLIEKPLSVNAGEARKLCVAAEEKGRRVFVGCCLRFSEPLNTFRALVGSMGRLHSLRIECQSYLPEWRPARSYQESYSARAVEGGVLRDLIHEIDYAGWIFGWPKVVQASVRNLGRLGIEADELAELMWETEDGCVVSVSLDYLTRPSRRRMTVMGEWGTLEWDAIENTITVFPVKDAVRVERSQQTRDAIFLEQDRAFINTAQGICDPRLATGQDGVRALAVCDAARRASLSCREELVEYL